MAKRTYGQLCALAAALDVVGERWTLLVVRELVVGPQRFSDLLRNLPGIGTNLLAARLRSLEAEDVVRRDMLPPPAASAVYELTAGGRALANALVPLAAWAAPRVAGEISSGADGHHRRSSWILLLLQASHRRPRPETAGTYGVDVDGERFMLRSTGAELSVAQGPWTAPPDAVLSAGLDTLADVAAGLQSPAAAVRAGRARVVGGRAACGALLRLLDRTS